MNKYISILTATITAFFFVTPALAEKISLDDLSEYINNLPMLKADFKQINSDGSQDLGQLYMRRPGKMRLEYAAPNNALVIVGSNSVAIYDDKSKNGPSIFPLKSTPLNLLLAKNVDLKNNIMISKHIENQEFTFVTARDPKGKAQGKIEMIFSNNPITLREWIITDQSNQETKVILEKLREQTSLPWRLFSISANKPDID